MFEVRNVILLGDPVLVSDLKVFSTTSNSLFLSWSVHPVVNKNTTLILSITDTNNTTNITVELRGDNNVYKYTEDTPKPCNVYNFTLLPGNLYAGCNQSKSMEVFFVTGTCTINS